MNELSLFKVDNAIGGNQDWFTDYWMKLGGCGAVTACDICIYFAMFFQKKILYPYNTDNITQKDYIHFSNIMKPYLSPRIRGIDTLEIFINGFKEYLHDNHEENIKFQGIYANCPLEKYKALVRQQIDKKMPVPYLNLKHKNPVLSDYVWHWFWLAGYKELGNILMVKAVSYGNYRWLSLDQLWDTGYTKKGGIILIG
ncbi:hypothetical protein [Pectinatus sottacetonis]|uniref:hypothetical protein n=1 Tax=Pectinatus sottacetonis TaxID=1002795 RepID=UPI0018C63FCC|nr:hypothetical protein [Pectinatus sottacetonis]